MPSSDEHRRDFAKVQAMRTWGKKSIVVAGSIVMLVVLTSCGMGKTLNATRSPRAACV